MKKLPALVLLVALVFTLCGASVAFADPPARVGRLSYFSGAVSFSPGGDDQWAYVTLNRPVTTGDRLWSDNGARVELTLDNGALWLGATTSVVVSNIDDRTTQLELQQGVLDLRVRRMYQQQVVEVDTPNLAFQVTRPGRYRIAVDPQSGTTTVIVRNGMGEVYGERSSYVVLSGQGYRFYSTNLTDSEYFTPRGPDDFERFTLQRDARFDRSTSARFVSRDVIGYEDLDSYGTWTRVETYGNVWFPREVPNDWAPYRHGHWSWIDPWGWTWVDEAPWGFAPFHYGRWAYVSNRWGWVPGPVEARPVYAPALVAFVSAGNVAAASSAAPAIAWFPLAPREVYRPAYNVSREYYRQVNVSNTVINTTVINNTYVTNVTKATPAAAPASTYVNVRAPNAITAVPPAAFAQAQPVNRAAVRVASTVVNNAPVQSTATVAPARTAFIGGANVAPVKPPVVAEQRTVLVRSVPPPAPASVIQRVQALEKQPGKPLDRAEPQAGVTPTATTATPPRHVKIVDSGKPTTNAAPPAAQGDPVRARSAPSGAAPAAATAPDATAPAARAPGAPQAAAPAPGTPPPPSPGRPTNAATSPTSPAATAASPPPAALPQAQPQPGAPVPPARPPESTTRERGRPDAAGSAAHPGEPGTVPPDRMRRAPPPPAPVATPAEPRPTPQEQARPVPQPPAPVATPPERKPLPQEQARPVPQPPAPVAKPAEPRPTPQEQARPVAQPQGPVATPPERKPPPQEQARPVARPPAPVATPPERKAPPQEHARPVPQPPAAVAAPPERKPPPQEQSRPVSQPPMPAVSPPASASRPPVQVQPPSQPVPAAPKVEPRHEDGKDKGKGKDNDKDNKEKDKEKDKEKK